MEKDFDGFADGLIEETLTEMAGTFFGARKGLEDELKVKKEEIDNIQQEFKHRRARTAAAGTVSETVITQPVLDEGGEESAILVEPAQEEVDEPTAGDAASQEKAEDIDPEKEG